jgi:hypothetical protein
MPLSAAHRIQHLEAWRRVQDLRTPLRPRRPQRRGIGQCERVDGGADVLGCELQQAQLRVVRSRMNSVSMPTAPAALVHATKVARAAASPMSPLGLCVESMA